MEGEPVSSTVDPAVRLLADRAEIHDVMMRYAAGVDRRDFELVRACFTPDVSGWSTERETLIEFISGVRTFEMTMHMMGNQLIEVRGDDATMHTYAMLTHHRPGYYGGTYELNPSGNRYAERLVRQDRWVIAQRRADPLEPPTGVTAVTTTDASVQYLLDRAEIHDLIMRYAQYVDTRDWDGAGSCLASSFEFRAGNTLFDDADKLFDYLRSTVERYSSTNHFLGTQLVEVDGDTAICQTVALITLRDHSQPPGETVPGGFVYVDELVREGGRWKLAGRNRQEGPPPRPRSVPHASLTSNDPIVQWLLDRAAIEDLIAGCALAIDREDSEAVEACFVPDATIAFGNDAVRQASGYVGLLRMEMMQWHSTSHYLGNQLIDLRPDDADVDTYLYFTSKATADSPPTSWAHGARRFADRVVRTDGQWRIAERRLTDNQIEGQRLGSYVTGWRYPFLARG